VIRAERILYSERACTYCLIVCKEGNIPQNHKFDSFLNRHVPLEKCMDETRQCRIQQGCNNVNAEGCRILCSSRYKNRVEIQIRSISGTGKIALSELLLLSYIADYFTS
jgi:hypothetical protein